MKLKLKLKLKLKIIIPVFVIVSLAVLATVNLVSVRRAVPMNADLKETITFSQMKSDCKVLEKILSKGYVGFYDSANEGIDVKNISAEILQTVKSKSKNQKTVLVRDFEDAIFSALQKNLKNEDMHFCVAGNQIRNLTNPFILYYSDVSFKKVDKKYFVEFSSDEKIKRGMEYTGLEKNLFREIIDGEEFYRFGIFTDKNLTQASISLGEERIIVPVKKLSALDNRIGFLEIKQNEKSLYIALGDTMPRSQDDPAVLKIVSSIRARKNENVILDLRGNAGGVMYIVNVIASELFFDNDENVKRKFLNEFDKARRGDLLSSPIISQANDNLMKREGYSYSKPLATIAKFIPKIFIADDGMSKSIDEFQSLSKFDGKLFILIDNTTASSAEVLVAMSLLFGKEKVVLLGGNSLGSVRYSNCHDYYLPHSGILLARVGNMTHSNYFLDYSEKFLGEGKGFAPDYWIFDDNPFEQ